MTDLQHHYKERSPEDTVQIIKDFFASNDIRLNEIDLNESESGTWYCHVDAYKDNIHIGGTNGKGVSRSYALASGYAELYERFCNKIWFINGPYWTKDCMKTSKEKYGYYFHRNEKILNRYEILHNSKRVEHYFNHFTKGIPELEDAALSLITDDIYVGVPLKNIEDENDVMYVDPRILMRITRSNGMAAGNTLEEALNQGLSELLEREVNIHFFNSFYNEMPNYKALNLDKIDDPTLKSIINKIQALGYTFYLFDLSYTFNMPVIMSLLLDKDNGHMNINFGSFPVFEIAAERVLTELYQGIKSYKTKDYQMSLQVPFKAMNFAQVMSTYGNCITGELFCEEFFNHIEMVDTYNDKIFISKDSSNSEIFNYFKTFSKNNKDIKFYYLDNSLIPDIYAVHILLESGDNYLPMCAEASVPIIWNDITIQQGINAVKKIKAFYDDIYYNRTGSAFKLLEIVKMDMSTKESPVGALISNFCLWNTFSVVGRDRGFDIFSPFVCLSDIMFSLPNAIIQTEFHTNYKRYLQLINYVRCEQYTESELFNIFNNIFNYHMTLTDIQHAFDSGYLLKRVYIDSLVSFLSSDSYKALVDIFVNNNLS